MDRYLVTGGCGFIGSYLCQYLITQGAHVIVLDNLDTGKKENLPENVEFIENSINNAACIDALFREKNLTGCFHLAAIASVIRCQQAWHASHSVNVGGFINLLNAAKTYQIPIVYASSAAVYGASPAQPLSESQMVHPISAYGVDKLACEGHAHVATKQFGIPTVGLRFFNVFGSGQNPNSPYSGVLSIFMDRLKQKKVIQIYGDGMQTRDFIYIKDIVAYLWEAMQRSTSLQGRVFNVCAGKETSLNQLLTLLANLWQVDPEIERHTSREGDIQHSVGDCTQLNAAFDYKTRFSLEAGLREFLEEIK